MNKSFNISINLLPAPEIAVVNREKKFKKVQLFAMIVVIILFFLTSVTFALSITQSARLKKSEASFNLAKDSVEKFKQKEIQLLVLKDRLQEIDRLKSQKSKQAQMYGLITQLIPQQIFLNNININANLNTNLNLASADIQAIDLFLYDLLDKQKNEELVKSVAVESLSRGKDGFYRVSFNVSN